MSIQTYDMTFWIDEIQILLIMSLKPENFKLLLAFTSDTDACQSINSTIREGLCLTWIPSLYSGEDMRKSDRKNHSRSPELTTPSATQKILLEPQPEFSDS